MPLPLVAELPDWANILAWLLAIVFSAMIGAWHKPRPRTTQNEFIPWPVLLSTALALTLMRYFNTATLNGVMLHFTGASIATLMLGTANACRVMALVSLSGVLQGAFWYNWAADFLVSGLLPVMVTSVISSTARRWLPCNIFSYVMFNAFFAAALSMATSIVFKALVAACLGDRNSAFAYLAAMPLLMFAEAFFSGVTMVLIVVYRPQWCSSFDDRLYLWPQRPV